MKEKDQAQLEAFLGFPLLGWLEGMPLPALARLCVFLFRQKSAIGKHPMLEPVLTREYQLLQFRPAGLHRKPSAT